MRKIERRFIATARTSTDGRRTLAGTAVPYDGMSHVLRDRPRPYRERFTRGALEIGDGVTMQYGHDLDGVPLAAVRSGTLRFRETDQGLEFEADLPEARADIREALERGDLTGAVSIGFYLREGGDEWNNRTNPAVRTVRAAELVELSICREGAYPAAKGSLQ
jgi:HK97 family phage prohead protease